MTIGHVSRRLHASTAAQVRSPATDKITGGVTNVLVQFEVVGHIIGLYCVNI